MKKLTMILLASVFAFLAYTAYADTLEGKVVDLSQYIMNGEGDVSKAEAIEMVKAGKELAFVSDGKLYLVFSPNTAPAYRDLARNADNKNLKITGKVHNKNGFQYIIADKWE